MPVTGMGGEYNLLNMLKINSQSSRTAKAK